MCTGKEAGGASQDIRIYAWHFDIGLEPSIWLGRNLSNIFISERDRGVHVEDMRSCIEGMPILGMRIKFKADGVEFEGELNNSKTAKAIYNKLPLEAIVDTWGDEIYFDIGLRLLSEKPTLKVKVGDIAYWAKGSSMCIFFGPTPISKGDEPRPASEVNLIGATNSSRETLKKIKAGSKITIEQAV